MPDANDPGAKPPKKRAEPSPMLPRDLLVIDDEVLLTMDIEEILHHLGVASVRSATNITQAMQAIDERIPDFVLLDVTLGTETSFDIARRLQTLGVRFAFVTGYGDDLAFAGEFSKIPKIRKPYTAEMLRAALA
jgi:DNA-binding NtrC family response regulator